MSCRCRCEKCDEESHPTSTKWLEFIELFCLVEKKKRKIRRRQKISKSRSVNEQMPCLICEPGAPNIKHFAIALLKRKTFYLLEFTQLSSGVNIQGHLSMIFVHSVYISPIATVRRTRPPTLLIRICLGHPKA